jgi:hypothetical protein
MAPKAMYVIYLYFSLSDTSVGKNYVKEEESLTKIGFEVGYVESLL